MFPVCLKDGYFLKLGITKWKTINISPIWSPFCTVYFVSYCRQVLATCWNCYWFRTSVEWNYSSWCLVPGIRDAFFFWSIFNQAEMAVYRRGFPQMPWVISRKDPIYHPTLSPGWQNNRSNWFSKSKYILPVVPLHFGSEPCQPASSNLFFFRLPKTNTLKKQWIK